MGSTVIVHSDLVSDMPNRGRLSAPPRGFSKSFVSRVDVFFAQNAFIYASQRVFLELLPVKNYISGLGDNNKKSTDLVAHIAGAKQETSAYVSLKQPDGYDAVVLLPEMFADAF